MKIVSTEELINFKILPYNVYSEFGEKLFAAGEVLTPGKLLQLRHMNVLYRDDELQKLGFEAEPQAKQASVYMPKDMGLGETSESSDSNPLSSLNTPSQQAPDPVNIQYQMPSDMSFLSPDDESMSSNYSESGSIVFPQSQTQQPNQPQGQEFVQEKPKPKIIVESYDMNPVNRIHKDKLSVDDIDILSYRGPINKKAKIDPQTQIKIKAFYIKILEMMDEKRPGEMLGMFANVRDKIIQDIIFESNEIFFSSQLKLLGEYKKCHALNTAILSGSLAKKMGLGEGAIFDIVLAGLLHDIGKTLIPEPLLLKTNLTNQEQKIIQNHTRLGYKIIRNEMDLPDNIAKAALDHHEKNDGSGYPNGKSGESINVESQIINVCNTFDNITSNRTIHKIKNTKEALRVMLALGTNQFSAEALYTFVHMFSYNDTMNFEEMVL